MTLDPVHLEGIADLVAHIGHQTETTDQQSLAEDVWSGYLDPLWVDGETVLEPIDELDRFSAPVDAVGVQDAPFDAVHGLDAGTVNPRTFANGIVLDVAQAAMSVSPSSMPLHRERSIVACVHTNDATVDATRGWTPFDEGFGRGRIEQVPRLARDRQRAVHGLALALAESSHALELAERVEEVLIMDGPLYPPPVVAVAGRQGAAGATLAESDLGREVCATRAHLIDTFVERDIPLVGFVKTAESSAILRALGNRERPPPTPWADDLALFSRLLEPGTAERRLAWTNWFVSGVGGDGMFAGESAPPGVDRTLSPADYRVAFFVCLDPRTDQAFRVEVPAAQAQDAERREAVRRAVLRGVAAEAGPPPAIRKADAIARIDAGEKESLLERIELALDTTRTRGYDELRWGIDA